jgi:hypothetical protein
MFSMEGNLPSPVFKGDDDQRCSAVFAERGRIRLGGLHTYRRIESAGRRDASEGVARLLIPHEVTTLHLDRQTLQLVGESVAPGHLDYGDSFHNPLYAFCVAGSDCNMITFEGSSGVISFGFSTRLPFLPHSRVHLQALTLLVEKY